MTIAIICLTMISLALATAAVILLQTVDVLRGQNTQLRDELTYEHNHYETLCNKLREKASCEFSRRSIAARKGHEKRRQKRKRQQGQDIETMKGAK